MKNHCSQGYCISNELTIFAGEIQHTLLIFLEQTALLYLPPKSCGFIKNLIMDLDTELLLLEEVNEVKDFPQPL